MSAAAKFAPRYTREDYALWKGDWELWNGIAIAMTPSPFGRHQDILARLLTDLRLDIERRRCEATALSELDWIVSNDTVVRPDIVIVCGGAPEKHLEVPPAMVAEILSPSTRQNDLTYKRELYARQGVDIYLIVDPETQTIEQLTLTTSGSYESVEISSPLKLRFCDDCVIEIAKDRLFS